VFLAARCTAGNVRRLLVTAEPVFVAARSMDPPICTSPRSWTRQSLQISEFDSPTLFQTAHVLRS
jgi:hypothetical protein